MFSQTSQTSWTSVLTRTLYCLSNPFFTPSVSATTSQATSLLKPGPPPIVTLPKDILTTLPPLLSPQTQILLPSSPSFRLYSSRFAGTQGAPNLLAIILPVTERDISTVIKYSNNNSIPFLASSGQHGSWHPLSQFSGIAISLRNLSPKITLSQDGKQATIGGGTSIAETVHYLWSQNKRQTTTGICECVGVVSPGLGGGHGLLQGQYGLSGDQWVSARVVLGSGRVITVNEEENKDLWWGLRGAGHNFGVVSEVKVKVYEPSPSKTGWSWAQFVFEAGKLEGLYKWVNGFVEGVSQVEELTHWSVWGWDKDVDSEKPVINFLFFYNGPADELKKYSNEVQKLGPAAYREGVVADYPDMAKVIGVTLEDGFCQKGSLNAMLRAADVISYEIPALRKAYELFSTGMRSEPAFAGSVVMLEGYSVQAVQAVPAESTAYAHRAQRIVQAPNIGWPIGNKTLDEEAQRWGKQIWKALSGTAQKRSYANYAWGDEGPQALYGYEPWRLQKLKTLKKKYDPQGRFGYFASVDTKSKAFGDI
ncbi:hypothetical protein QBC44DRAFT_322800 [Cladorrhinum sp. PSN332]|nr:hypothetical protein QBC44DRAFT_322800 [Cladorrhinum sp. PSN332]